MKRSNLGLRNNSFRFEKTLSIIHAAVRLNPVQACLQCYCLINDQHLDIDAYVARFNNYYDTNVSADEIRKLLLLA